MSIQSADNENGAVQLSYKIVMQVETSDGYSATYVGDNTSYVMAVPPRQINGTMMRVVHEMLMDKNIVDFLTK